MLRGRMTMQDVENFAIKQAIIDEIEAYDVIIIHRHQRPDPDAIGSQTGLKEIIQQKYPNKCVYAVGHGIGDMDYLSPMDDIEDSVYKGSLAIVTDTANEKRICDKRYALADKIIKIDHHPKNDDGNYASLSWADDSYSSCSEMIAELSFDFAKALPMNDEAARLLYAGIVADTNRFLYNATSRHTMEIAGKLMDYDFDHTQLNDEMNCLSAKEAKLIGYTMSHIKILASGAAYIVFSHDVLKEMDMTSDETNAVVAIPRNLEHVLAWIIFVEESDGNYRARIRSKGPIINQLAAAHHGGGHQLASGANAYSTEEIKQMVDELDRLVVDYTKMS